MEFRGMFKIAGEPTDSIPLNLCEQAHNSLKIWSYTDVNSMRDRLKEEIESLDRWEFQAIENGEMKAMMIITIYENEPHLGHDVLISRFAFSTDRGALKAGYKWMKKLARLLKIRFMVTTRQHKNGMDINHKISEVK